MAAEGDFSMIRDEMTRMTYEDMYAAITKAEAWADMKKEPTGAGFMFSSDSHISRIHAKLIDRVGHSGASMACTMRAMQHLAQVGWSTFIAPYAAAATSPVDTDPVPA